MSFHELALPRVLCLVLVLLLWGEVPPAFEFSAMGLLLLSIAVASRKVRPPPKWVVPTLALASGIVIYGAAGTLIGREPSAALLAVLAGLKALESREASDERTLSLIGLFLTAVVVLFRTDLWMTLFSLACCWGFLWLIFRRAPAALSRRGAWHWVWRLSLQAMPLTVLLFLVVPRLQHTGLWGSTGSSQSGFREELTPSLVEKIEVDTTPVFRVDWPEARPPRPIFWRGAVLSEPRGFSWRPASVDRGGEEVQATNFEVRSNPNGPAEKRIQWLLEPQSGRWSFAPEGTRLVREADTGQFLEFDRESGIWRVNRTPGKRLRLEAIFGAELLKESNQEAWSRRSPASEKTLAWVNEAIGTAQTRTEKMSGILKAFAPKGFVYTREPGRIADLDDFLNQRRGFCEHYASATASLGRLAGVPTRVVVGFLGGDYNPVGQFLLVTKADAHAWTEFLDDDGIWRTADATGFVPPLDPLRDRRAPSVDPEQASWWERVKWNFDAINYQVAGFLMSFDLEAQAQLWNQLRAWSGAIPVLIFFALGLLTLIFFRGMGEFIFWKQREAAPVRRYRQFIEKQQGQGRAVSFHSGPLENLKQLSDENGNSLEESEKIVQEYIRHRYRPTD